MSSSPNAATDGTSEDDLRMIIADLTPGDLALVITLAEALRDNEVAAAELQGLTDVQWMALIAARRAA